MVKADKIYHQARAEHAMLLRCEGMVLREIGTRLGISREQARSNICKGARRLAWAMQRTKLHGMTRNETKTLRFAVAKENIRKDILWCFWPELI